MSEEPFGASERMPQRRARGLVGPLMLILVGVVLLLKQLDIWDLDWSYVWRLWPLGLILVGLDMILGRLRLGGFLFPLVATAVIVLAVLLVPWAAPTRRNYERETFSYPAKGLETATIRLEPGVARLEILAARDSTDLIELEASYDKRQRRLVQNVDIARDVATIHIESKEMAVHWTPFGSRYAEEWRVWLDPEIPLQLEVDIGVGRADLDLADLTLTRLDLNAGVGEVAVVLSGKGDYDAFINGGVGSLTVEIPKTIEASIRLDEGIGSVSVGRRYELRVGATSQRDTSRPRTKLMSISMGPLALSPCADAPAPSLFRCRGLWIC